MKKAGFWRRFAAIVLDGFILSPSWIFWDGSWMCSKNGSTGDAKDFHTWFAFQGVLILGVVYETILVSQWGGYTVGKKIMGVRVVTVKGKQPDWVQAFVRAASKNLSEVVFLIGYLSMLWDKKSQTWHDKIADTFVVEKGDKS